MKTKLTLIILLVLTTFNITSLGVSAATPEPTPIQTTHFGSSENTPQELSEDWFKTFNKDNCRATIQNVPFEIAINDEYKIQTNAGVIEYKENNTLKTVVEDTVKLKELVPICACINSFPELKNIALVLRSQLPSTTPTPEQIDQHKSQLGKKAWLEKHVTSTNNTNNACSYINIKQTQTQPPSQNKNISYCLYNNITGWNQLTNIDNIKTIQNLKNLDFESNDNGPANCKIDTDNEKCKANQFAAIQKCQSNPKTSAQELAKNIKGPTTANDPQDNQGPILSCSNIVYYGCIGQEKPQYLNIDTGYTSESLDVNKVLKREDQQGFIKIGDQGAGENNPLINTILYIINLLTNLSFLVSVMFLIIGGFYLVLASGNSEMTDKGKDAIKNFIFAITFTLLSYTIVIIIRTLLYS